MRCVARALNGLALSAFCLTANAQAAEPTGPLPINAPGTWFSTNDYPIDALRREQEGAATVELTIDKSGKVTSCTVTQTSGVKSIDTVTCGILSMRVRFAPARDTEGRAVAGKWTRRVSWKLPTQSDIPIINATYGLVTTADVDEFGNFSNCTEGSSLNSQAPADLTGTQIACPNDSGLRKTRFLDANGKLVKVRIKMTKKTEVTPL
jgi:periplasmic protein TonB